MAPAPRFVVEHKLYWAAFSDPDEAHYVIAVLNSDTANQAIKPFQSTGLMGERDIEKKFLELPIPTFDPADQKHRDLSEFAKNARAKAQEVLQTDKFPQTTSIARQRGFMRAHLKTELNAIDKIVANLVRLGS